jgi:hypothetical protein
MENVRKTLSTSWRISITVLVTLIIIGCGGEDGTPVSNDPPGEDPPPDTIAPAGVTDLDLRAPTLHSLALVWKSPGDDGQTGTAKQYDIRSSKAVITDANWDQATPMGPSDIPVPKPGGQIETCVVPGLESGVVYYFALKTSDEVGNQSELSNCASERTLYENVPPSSITDLAAVAIDETSFELTWTASGDDGAVGTASEYDIRYWARPIVDESSWEEATRMPGSPTPQPAGESENVTVTGLTPGTSYFFAVKTADEVSNWSGLSNLTVALAQGHFVSAAPKAIVKGDVMYITFEAADVGFTTVSLHAETFEPKCGEDVADVLAHDDFSGGTHTITYDFYSKRFEMYWPTLAYIISVCWGTGMKERIDVHFDNSAVRAAADSLSSR